MTSAFDFDEAFDALTGYAPFPWQRRLFDEWMSDGKLPSAVDIPTGLGKTAVMVVWLLARARGAALPRRLAYVVDRRAVVDQATDYAETLRQNLSRKELDQVRLGLGLGNRSLPISTLRGRYADNREWLDDPAATAIIVGTVDMIGSRLLFEGYGVSRRMRPYAAGLMGCDTLVMLDEAHLSRPFERLLRAIENEQRVSAADRTPSVPGLFSGPSASATLPPPIRVLPLSATLCGGAEGRRFELDRHDRENGRVRKRLDAVKTLTIEDLEGESKLEEKLAERAWQLARDQTEKSGKPARVLVYCDRRTVAENVANDIRRRVETVTPRPEAILFVGGRRVHEREEAAQRLKGCGLIGGCDAVLGAPVFVVATAAGEVGVDLGADHMVCDLVAWERMVQRLGRVNRRGTGAARVIVIDQGPPEDKTAEKEAIARHAAVRVLLEALRPAEETGYPAGPAALAGLGERPGLRSRIEEATTLTPLYPELTRPLVDAWAMTSLAEHTGRPEVGPWLRGWVDDEPQTTVVWRRHLPLRVDVDGANVRVQDRKNGEAEAFFDAASPQVVELLETETRRVADWLRKRAGKLSRLLQKRLRQQSDAITDGDVGAVTGGDDSFRSLKLGTPIAFILGVDGEPEGSLSLAQAAVTGRAGADLRRRLIGRRLIVDARIGGLKDGLLDENCEEDTETIEDNWGKPEAWEELGSGPVDGTGLPNMRVRLLTDNELRAERTRNDPWREAATFSCRVDSEGETQTWLIVENLRGGDGGEEAKAVASKTQRLDEHHAWVADEVTRIAEAIGLSNDDREMLVAAARHHDDGKKAPRWQRAFNAPHKGGPYAKTVGPFNRHVLNRYRHELQSALDAVANGLDSIDRTSPHFELALHLIAAHHGNARPVIGIEGCDSLPPAMAAKEAHKIAVRFAMLQRLWGPWGLAWWEALLRAADQRASRALNEEAMPTSEPGGSGIITETDAREHQPSLYAPNATWTG